jgi:hypothetical protein
MVLAVAKNAAFDSYVTDELVVTFKSGLRSADMRSIHKKLQTKVIKKVYGMPNIDVVTLPEGTSVVDAAQQYMADPSVEYAEPNYVITAKTTIPNDEFFPQQWALMNNGTFADGKAGADIKAYLAWDITTGSNVPLPLQLREEAAVARSPARRH